MSRAVIVSGDAARGSFQAGVLQMLPFVPDTIYGTSSGALNGCMYAYCSPREIAEEWLSIRSVRDVYAFNWLAALWRPGMFNNGPLLKRVRRIVASGSPKCRVVVTVTDTATSKVHYVDNAAPDFAEAVAASATITGLCCPLETSRHTGWTDGGLRELAPIEKAVSDGHDDITLILSRPWGADYRTNWKPKPFPLTAYSAALRAVDLMLHEIAWNDVLRGLALCKRLTVYAPTTPLQFGLLDICPEVSMQAMAEGRMAKPRVILSDEASA
jgi:predicted acylesterase/phospholipase RssA